MDAATERDFTSFVEARSHALFRTALALTGHRQRAEDLLQMVLAKAARHWHRLQGHPEAYIRKAMYRQQVSWWRRAAHTREVPTDQLPEPPAATDPTAHIDLAVVLGDALRRLPARQRAVLVLRYLEDRPDREIAEILGCAPATVRSLASRALARLRDLYPHLRDVPTARQPTPQESRR